MIYYFNIDEGISLIKKYIKERKGVDVDIKQPITFDDIAIYIQMVCVAHDYFLVKQNNTNE